MIRIDEPLVEFLGEGPADCRLAGAHQADEEDAVTGQFDLNGNAVPLPFGVVTLMVSEPAAQLLSGLNTTWWNVPPIALVDGTVAGKNVPAEILSASTAATAVPKGSGLLLLSTR